MKQVFRRASAKQTDTVDVRYFQIQTMISTLQSRCKQGLPCDLLLDSILRILESLPLSTDEYGRAICHLSNCERYLKLNERGAAVYELRLLAAGMSG